MSVPRISKEDLKQRLDAGDPPVIIDLRLKYPFEHSTVTLPGALRFSPDHIDASQLARDRDIVVYDSDPGELVSERIAEDLRRRGYRVSVLQGSRSRSRQRPPARRKRDRDRNRIFRTLV